VLFYLLLQASVLSPSNNPAPPDGFTSRLDLADLLYISCVQETARDGFAAGARLATLRVSVPRDCLPERSVVERALQSATSLTVGSSRGHMKDLDNEAQFQIQAYDNDAPMTSG
jgi:hypothetical protein